MLQFERIGATRYALKITCTNKEMKTAMAEDRVTSPFVTGLTKPKGVMLAAGLLVGAAVLISTVSGGDNVQALDAKAPVTATAGVGETGKSPAVAEAKFLANEAQASGQLVQQTAADKPATTAGFSSPQRDEIGKIVREYLLANPGLLVEISQKLEQQRKDQESKNQQNVLVSQKDSIFRSPNDFVLGNPDGDVTVVEYFDYNCGWCKRALNEINELTATDKNVRVVMKEFPIFGEDSTFAAKAALASIPQGKYWEFHTALMAEERVTKDNTFDVAKRVGIDVDALKKEMEDPKYDAIIAENTRVAQELGMQGTPGFIIDSRVNFGYVPAATLTTMLADIRKEGCNIC